MNNQQTSRSERIKILASIAVIAFSIVLAVIVGYRLSDEALAVLAGAVCGVGSAIPTGLLIIVLVRRNDQRNQPVRHSGQYQNGQYPPVIVVNPGTQNQSQLSPPQAGEWMSPTIERRPARRFTIVGDGYED